MKQSIFKLGLLMIAFSSINISSCNKDEEDITPVNYGEITRDDIEARDFILTTEMISATNSTGHILDVSDVIIYKTSQSMYGKLEILGIDDIVNYKLTIKAVTYNADGTIFNQTESLDIRGTHTCDLDAMVEIHNLDSDFWWERKTSKDTSFSPKNSARFTEYDF